MLSALKHKMLEEMSASFTRQELIWAHGFISGALAKQGEPLLQALPSDKKIFATPKEKDDIFSGQVISAVNLNDIGSTKETHHIEILAEDAQYEPGDAISFIEESGYADRDPQRYLIASSPEAHSGELHITIPGSITIQEGASVKFRIHKNEKFRLPSDEKDVIMIGPGAGIAPFRSFLAHRDAIGSNGKNWLFFSEQHFVSDFLYQTELQNWVETGSLTKLNVAFAGDHEKGFSLSDAMLRQGRSIAEWLKNGAFLYICAGETVLTEEINNTLINILTIYLHQSETEALAYVEELKNNGRYRIECPASTPLMLVA
ncbi:MAG: hypothetical protein JNL51_18235 [Chitinophagaceae bacterium]|nr:hypothetical protein [Chitinophagaceae bacterium]